MNFDRLVDQILCILFGHSWRWDSRVTNNNYYRTCTRCGKRVPYWKEKE